MFAHFLCSIYSEAFLPLHIPFNSESDAELAEILLGVLSQLTFNIYTIFKVATTVVADIFVIVGRKPVMSLVLH